MKRKDPPPRKKSDAPQRAKKEAERATEPMNITQPVDNIANLLPHIESMNIPHDAAATIVRRMFPHGVPDDAMPAAHSLFSTINAIGPAPSSINAMVTMAMGGFNANDASSAEHVLNLNVIAQLSAAMRNKIPHVNNNRTIYETSQEDLQRVVERHLCLHTGKFDADAILSELEQHIARVQNPFDESRNLGLFVQSVPVPTIDVSLPVFYIADILSNLIPTNDAADACSWGGYCTVITHGSPLTFRVRNTRKLPLRRWRTREEHITPVEARMCIVCEIMDTYAQYISYKRSGRNPPRIIQKFSVACDTEVGLPESALIFPESSFNGLIAPFVNGDWLLTHLVAPPASAGENEPYTLLRGYFQKR